MKSLKWILPLIAAAFLTVGPVAHSGFAAQKKGKPAATAQKSADDSKLVDINTAPVADLEALPGIGKVRAEAIVKNRPYAKKNQLVSKGVLPQGVYDKISDRIIAKQ